MRYASRGRARWLVASALAVLGLLPTVIGCRASEESGREREAERASRRAAREAARTERFAPYQSEVEESLGAAVAILVDTSGSMRGDAPGDTRPKSAVAREAIEAMVDATDAFVAKRPDFPIKVGLYSL